MTAAPPQGRCSTAQINAIDVLTEAGGSGDLAAIKNQVDEILDLTRSVLSPNVSTSEVSLFVDNTPAKNKKGVSIKVDLSNLSTNDEFIIREKYRLENGSSMIQFSLDADNTYAGIQTPPGIVIHMEPYRYGAQLVAVNTSGIARIITAESFVEE